MAHVACVMKENTYNILVGKPEEKRPLERPRCRWKLMLKRVLKK
jgi:hypothetical protein